MKLTNKEKALLIMSLRAYDWAVSGNERNLEIDKLIEKIEGAENE